MEQIKKALLLGKSGEENAGEAAGYVRAYLQKNGFTTEWIHTAAEEGQRKLNEETLGQADLIVTFDLAGFERSTQSGSFLYNILPVKSIHFVKTETEAVLERLQKRKISIALFFVFLDMQKEEYKKIEKELQESLWMQPCPVRRQEVENMLTAILGEIFPDSC